MSKIWMTQSQMIFFVNTFHSLEPSHQPRYDLIQGRSTQTKNFRNHKKVVQYIF